MGERKGLYGKRLRLYGLFGWELTRKTAALAGTRSATASTATSCVSGARYWTRGRPIPHASAAATGRPCSEKTISRPGWAPTWPDAWGNKPNGHKVRCSKHIQEFRTKQT